MDFAEELIISSFLNSCIVSPNDKKLTTVPPFWQPILGGPSALGRPQIKKGH